MTIEQAKILARHLHAKLRQNHITIHPNGRVFIKMYAAKRLHILPAWRAELLAGFDLYIRFARDARCKLVFNTDNTLQFHSRHAYQRLTRRFAIPDGQPIRMRFQGKPQPNHNTVWWKLDDHPTTDLYALTKSPTH